MQLHGSCDPAFAAVKDTFAEHFERHPTGGPVEVGAAVCVEVDGRRVVDLWGGWADAGRAHPWQEHTVVCVFSCTKGLAALCLHQLVEQGRVELDVPVARYWPEFGAAGKEAVSVRHVLTHSAGLNRLRDPLPPGGVYDWATVTAALAAEAPHWEPGTAHGYHTLSFGHLVGEIVRRVDGRDLGTYVREELADPLGIDLYLGFGPEVDGQVAELLLPPESSMLGPAAQAARAIDPARIERYDDPHILTPPVCNSRPWRAAQIPGANGHANARALARVYGALARGGESLLRPETITAARQVQVTGPDRTIGSVTQFGLGWADPDAQVGFGFVFNQCGEPQQDGRATRLVEAAFSAF
jgi:CubicO group peptidase (beta-lactamase class C family)